MSAISLQQSHFNLMLFGAAALVLSDCFPSRFCPTMRHQLMLLASPIDSTAPGGAISVASFPNTNEPFNNQTVSVLIARKQGLQG